jgi:hypothetical protein
MKANISRILLFFFLCFHVQSFAQISINSTGTPPANNAMLDISSTTKGLLIPRMTTTERLALTPTQGLTVYDITTNGYWYYDNSAWVAIATVSNPVPWVYSGNHIYNSNLGNVGIGTAVPIAPLNIFRALGSYAQFQTTNTGTLGTDGFLMGITNVGTSAYVMNFENAPLILGTSATARIKIEGNGNVGIGTTTSNASFNVAEGKTVIFGGDSTTDSKTKFIWYGTKGALRVGREGVAGFDYASVGNNSVAMGHITHAEGNYATAFGNLTYAFGVASTAMGSGSSAGGDYSTAIGINTNATGLNSTALGRSSDTNNQTNSFCIAGSTIGASNTSPNQMMMRFDNYTFYVAGTNNYAYIIPASNGWAYTSDRNKKENFEELIGESVLKKIAKIPFYSWNFKDKEVKQYRHYGIMAQDFHDNFGKDNFGVIGNDTTVSALDLLGVAYSGIKALEKRTEELLTKNAELNLNNERLEAQVQFQNQKFSDEIVELRAMILPKKKKYALIRCKFDFEKRENRLSLK